MQTKITTCKIWKEMSPLSRLDLILALFSSPYSQCIMTTHLCQSDGKIHEDQDGSQDSRVIFP